MRTKALQPTPVTTLTQLLLLLFIFLTTIAMTKYPAATITIHQEGGKPIIYRSSADKGNQIVAMAIDRTEQAQDYLDSFILADQLAFLKNSRICLEILFPDVIEITLKHLNRTIQLDRLLVVYKKKKIQYIFWGVAEYHLDGEILGSSDPDERLLSLIQQVATEVNP